MTTETLKAKSVVEPVTEIQVEIDGHNGCYVDDPQAIFDWLISKFNPKEATLNVCKNKSIKSTITSSSYLMVNENAHLMLESINESVTIVEIRFFDEISQIGKMTYIIPSMEN